MRKIMRSIAALLTVALLAVALPLMTGSAIAQEAPRQPFAAPVAQQVPAQQTGERSIATKAWFWLMAQQQNLHREMAAAVKDLKTGDPARATFVLVAIAFLYGVLHAAGPGHGKAVISSYVLANEETARRGIALSFLAALIQAVSAIVFVGILAIAMNQTKLAMDRIENMVESISWALIAMLGAWMLYKQFQAVTPVPAASANDMSQRRSKHSGHHHDHDHHGPGCSCGHSHMPAPKDLQGAWSWRKAMPIALSVGIRPCTGAIILLIFAMSQGLLWAGILGTFAMALGTAITVSTLAAMAVSSRNWAERMTGAGSPWAARIHAAAGFAGASLVFLMGAAFFVASLNGPAPL